jgi:hypothetical protein
MPRQDNSRDLRKLVGYAVKSWAFQRLVDECKSQQIELSAELLRDALGQLPRIDDLVAMHDRPHLLQLAEKARGEGISIPRKQRDVSDNDADFWHAVQTRLAQGARSERDACEAEAVERGANNSQDMDRARSQYLRTDKRVRDILEAVGLDAGSLYKPCT